MGDGWRVSKHKHNGIPGDYTSIYIKAQRFVPLTTLPKGGDEQRATSDEWKMSAEAAVAHNYICDVFVAVQLGGYGAVQGGSERKTERRDQNTSPKEVLSGPL